MKRKSWLRVVGWGPFPLPGEKRREEKALREVRELMRIVEEAKKRDKPVV